MEKLESSGKHYGGNRKSSKRRISTIRRTSSKRKSSNRKRSSTKKNRNTSRRTMSIRKNKNEILQIQGLQEQKDDRIIVMLEDGTKYAINKIYECHDDTCKVSVVDEHGEVKNITVDANGIANLGNSRVQMRDVGYSGKEFSAQIKVSNRSNRMYKYAVVALIALGILGKYQPSITNEVSNVNNVTKPEITIAQPTKFDESIPGLFKEGENWYSWSLGRNNTVVYRPIDKFLKI